MDGKILLMRRPKSITHYPGSYEMPGGGVEKGETLHEAIKREFIEEANLKISIISPFNYFQYHTDGLREEIDFLVKLENKIENLKLNEEHTDYVWAAVPDLDSLPITLEMKDAATKALTLYKDFV